MELLHLNDVGDSLPLLNLPTHECPSNCIAHSVLIFDRLGLLSSYLAFK